MVIMKPEDLAKFVEQTETKIDALEKANDELTKKAGDADLVRKESESYKTEIAKLGKQLDEVINANKAKWEKKSEDEQLHEKGQFLYAMKTGNAQKIVELGGRLVSGSNKDGEWSVKSAPNVGTPLRGDAVTGSVLVPSIWESAMLMAPYQTDPLLSLATTVNMNARTVYLPKESTALSFTKVTDEVTAKTESLPAAAVMTLTAEVYALWLTLTEELTEDSSVDLVNYFSAMIGKAWQKASASALVAAAKAASGAASYAMPAGKTSFSDVTIDDMLALQSEITDQDYRNGAVLITHCTVVDAFKGKKDDVGNYLWQAPSAGNPGTLMGVRYIESNAMPDVASSAANTVFGIYCNPALLVAGIRKGLEVRMFDQTMDTAIYDRNLLRAKVRADFEVSFPAGIALLKTAAA